MEHMLLKKNKKVGGVDYVQIDLGKMVALSFPLID